MWNEVLRARRIDRRLKRSSVTYYWAGSIMSYLLVKLKSARYAWPRSPGNVPHAHLMEGNARVAAQ